ncbi:hypothetical protein L1987_05580 [Smallanthus sonchifolius]|uniref:Uncharacterized protein n=1 Tax=Smallanthus sonchifolius TaxID=185202 RepID=A0ACB9JVR9_9ASTR|nr:hypothetical protein L1987_05580 [Smallanthus sonchifolius]
MTPSLSLGSAYVNNMYQIQQQTQQEQKPYLQPHQLLLQQETQRFSPAVQRTTGEVHRSIAPSYASPSLIITCTPSTLSVYAAASVSIHFWGMENIKINRHISLLTNGK